MGAPEMGCLAGMGIDSGCGRDPVLPDVRCFDVEDGDANRISDFVREQFDFVFASHCLDYMHQPRLAALEWWKLVKPGGQLCFLVPDEDLYEEGVFPSRFNPDHRATFTIGKTRSWSRVSVPVLDLARSLPNGNIVCLALQDIGCDRRLVTHGLPPAVTPAARRFIRLYKILRNRLRLRSESIGQWMAGHEAVDRTLGPEAMARIQCIVRKDPVGAGGGDGPA
jgi:SAM-dependent methyltransferase